MPSASSISHATPARGQCFLQSTFACASRYEAQSCLVLKTPIKLVSCENYVTANGNSANSFAFSSATS